ncbi:unnamed protein product [Rotaria sp. Silwood1]|nr:unnamed protein product [Rotaria sp. Silwood1]
MHTENHILARFRSLILVAGLISLLAIIAQVIFQSILLANKPYGHTLNNCTKTTEILRYFGLERLDNSNAIRILRLIFPDIIIFAISTICFFTIRRTLIILRRRQRNEIQTSITSDTINISPSIDSSTSTTTKRNSWPRLLSIVRRIRLFIQFIIVGFAAFVYPSIINSIYFIFFLIIAFLWSLSINFGKKFALVRALLVIYTGLHLLTLYLYQFTFFQEALPPLSLWSNITGLTAIVTNNCTTSELYIATNLAWNDYVNPCAILLLYLYFAFETNRAFFQREVRSNTTTVQSLEQQSLVATVERLDTLEPSSRSLQTRWSFEQSNDQTWQGRIMFVVLSFLHILERQSYLLSLIVMLAWSITFHSLLTLVFLLWACLLWVLPNSRKWCLRMSPFFTIYGGILLILQYITGFKISFDQFQFAYDRRTMQQIGIRTNDDCPAFIPLLVKFEVVKEFLSARFSQELLASIGLEFVPSEVLAVRLLTPSAFLIVNIMQLYYFHSGWMNLITMPSDKNIQGPANGTLKDIHAYAKENTENVNSPHSQQILKNEPKTWQESLYKFYFRTNRLHKQIVYYCWRFAELHSYKLVLFIMVLVSVLKVCAFNISLIILTILGLILLRLRSLISLLTLIMTGLYILASMCYQLEIAKQQIIEKNIFVRNCSQVSPNGTLDPNSNTIPNDTAKWFGLELTTNIDRFIGMYILLTIVLTFDAIVRYRQRHRRLKLSVHFNVHIIENRFPIIFEPFALKSLQDDTYEYDINSYQQADQSVIDFLKYLINFVFYRFGLEICYVTTVIVIGVRLDVIAVFYAIWLGLFLISSRRFIKRIWPIYIFFQIISFLLQYLSAVGAPPILCFEYPWTNVNIKGWPQLKNWLYLPDYVDQPLATQLITDFFQFLFACQQWRVFAYEANEKYHVYTDAGGSNREIIYDDDVYKNNPTWDFVTNKRHWFDHIKYAIFMYGVWCVLAILYLAGTTRISLLGLGYLIACFYFLWYGQDFLTKRVTMMLRFYYWEHIVTELRSQAKLASQGAVLFNEISHKRIEEDRQREEQTVSKITRSLQRIKEQQSKLNQSNSKNATALLETSEHFEAIRSGDYYMFEYESEEQEDEEKPDEATVAEEQIFDALAVNDKDESASDIVEKSRKSSVIESDVQQLTTTSRTVPLPATTTEVIPLSPIPEQATSVESKEEKPIIKRKIIFIKIRLIIWIIVDYLINLFNRNSRDYREVLNKLAEMKSADKVLQHECIRMETSADQASVINIDQMAGGDYPNQNVPVRNVSQSSDLSQHSRFYRLCESLFYFIISRSELVCYSAMILNHLTSGTLLSMPLPLSIFLWATLSNRPSRNYWITILTYTEAMIVVKYIFQFRFYPWYADAVDVRPLSAINIIGINRKENSASVTDLILLLSLFLHRSILKQLGLWKAGRTTPNNSVILDADHGEQQQVSHKPLETTPLKRNTYFMKPVIKFYRQLKQALFVRDVYAPMFFCDFINMFIVIIFYSQFGERSGGSVVQTIQENKVPVAFLIILLVQFILIIIDRALYLRRNVRGKLFFQLFQVIAVHIWLFFVLPGITRMKFRDNVAAQFWYIFKCIYFGYSSIQVRLGYPKRIAGNFLMKRFNYFNQILYRIYLLIPFLLELRTIMDWMFTDTALGLTNWLQLEDVYSNIYLLKCARWAENKYPTKRGVPRTKVTKYGTGGSLLALLILLIWFPLLFFSFTSSFYQPNPPTEVNVEVKLGGYLPIYQMTAQDTDIRPYTSADYNSLRTSIYLPTVASTIEDTAYAFLRDFNPNDIHCVNLFSTSVSLWKISQPIRDIVVNSLRSNATVPVRFSYTITRNPPNQDDSEDITAIVTGENTVNIPEEDQQTRNALIEILNGTFDAQTSTEFTIRNLMPRFLHVKPKAKPEDIDSFKKVFSTEYYANITMGLNRTRSIPNSTEVCIIGIYISIISVAATFIRGELFGTTNTIMFNELPQVDALWHFLNDIYLLRTVHEYEIENDFFDRLIYIYRNPQLIIGLYTTFVIVVARLLRTTLQTSQTIMFNELPSVERFWQLLRDIYLVREHNMLCIEEQLFAKVIFLYRSPETLIRFTKPKID